MKKELSRISISLIGTGVLIFLAVVSAKYINHNWKVTQNELSYFRIASAGLIAWAVFGRLYNFESWKGKTFPEKFKKGWFIITYSIGFYGAVISLLLVSNIKIS
ncbi:MAG: hypothetical protein KZQ85_14895 [Candidatus Thiodiazotropha sp. (ex Myrtea sp. 'scaly one' KF741663)]|nr:hypothetical protein [Candidatus Thiodiazotropha sp. (ex Myrtea sp. 'scaly one' KF741663)]